MFYLKRIKICSLTKRVNDTPRELKSFGIAWEWMDPKFTPHKSLFPSSFTKSSKFHFSPKEAGGKREKNSKQCIEEKYFPISFKYNSFLCPAALFFFGRQGS